MKSFLTLFTVTLLTLNSFSTCQAMDPEAEWNDAFAAFTQRHAQLPIEACVAFVEDCPAYQVLGSPDPHTKAKQNQLYAVRDAIGSFFNNIRNGFENWIRITHYKNHPNLTEHSAEIVALSNAYRDRVLPIRRLVNNVELFFDTYYSDIETGITNGTVSPFDLLQRAEAYIPAMVQADAMITDLLNHAAHVGEAAQLAAAAEERRLAATREAQRLAAATEEERLAAAAAARLESLTRTINGGGFSLDVLNGARVISDELGLCNATTLNEYIARICRTVPIADESWRTEELFRAKVAEILDENFL